MPRLAGRPPAAPYDRISVAYDLVADPAEHQARDRGLDVLNARRGERVLEIGAGTGRALVSLARTVGPSGRVVGLDRSAGMLRLARQRLSSCQGRVDVQQGDARCLPYFTASFDAAFMCFTLELFDTAEIQLVLSEVRRVLRPRGRLTVVCLAAKVDGGLAAQAYTWLHRHFPHLIDCRPIDVLSHLERSGCRPDRVECMTLWHLPVMAVSARSISIAETTR
jgi:demethylmenaquinone methyltransferase/2-methoxy-6-polyprenyl-1,4-benzoquinol methylase